MNKIFFETFEYLNEKTKAQDMRMRVLKNQMKKVGPETNQYYKIQSDLKKVQAAANQHSMKERGFTASGGKIVAAKPAGPAKPSMIDKTKTKQTAEKTKARLKPIYGEKLAANKTVKVVAQAEAEKEAAKKASSFAGKVKSGLTNVGKKIISPKETWNKMGTVGKVGTVAAGLATVGGAAYFARKRKLEKEREAQKHHGKK